MARRHLTQEYFRNKFHRQLVARSTEKPHGKVPPPGSAKRAIRKYLHHS